jgi:predicted DNA-binding transcriptional regulator AlpA
MSTDTPWNERRRRADRRGAPSTVRDSATAAQRLLLTTEEVAAMIGVDPSTLRRWRTAQPMQGPPFIPISERVTKYRADDIDQWLARRRVTPGAA